MKSIFVIIISIFCFSNLYCQESNSSGKTNNDSIYNYNVVDSAPRFQSGDVYKWLGPHIVYPNSAVAKGVEGTVYVSFVVEKDGSVSTVKLLRGVDNDIDKEALRVISQMPLWSTGKIKGETVRVKLMLPIKFKLIEHTDTCKIYTSAEQAPKFPGDYEAWIKQNIQYSGTVPSILYLDVVVEKDGRLTNAKILHNFLGADSIIMAREALRLVKIMPKWNPAYQDGKPVRFEAAISVKFKPNDKCDNSKVYTYAEKYPKFSGKYDVWLDTNINYDGATAGVVDVDFIVEKDSSISNAKILYCDHGPDSIIMLQEALRLVKLMPKWTPAYQDKKPVRFENVIEIKFKPEEAASRVMASTILSSGYTYVKPQFPGDLHKWLSENITYPPYDQSHNIQGTVYVSFVIQIDGTVSNIKILKGVEDLLNSEAKWVISKMPKWKPGEEKGHAVIVQYMVPLHFVLMDNQSDKKPIQLNSSADKLRYNTLFGGNTKIQ